MPRSPITSGSTSVGPELGRGPFWREEQALQRDTCKHAPAWALATVSGNKGCARGAGARACKVPRVRVRGQVESTWRGRACAWAGRGGAGRGAGGAGRWPRRRAPPEAAAAARARARGAARWVQTAVSARICAPGGARRGPGGVAEAGLGRQVPAGGGAPQGCDLHGPGPVPADCRSRGFARGRRPRAAGSGGGDRVGACAL